MAKGKKTGGRQKGTPNKINGDVKGLILEALNGVGGAQYLEEKAKSHPQAFLALLGRVLPMQVSGDPDNPLKTSLEVTFK